MLLQPNTPALVLAPMDGITDAPMRALQGASGAFSYAVSEFVRVSGEPMPRKVFVRDIPELLNGGVTPTGMPVQVQLLGGDPGRLAVSAITAVNAGALGIDLNFGCPAPVVNRHDGGASLLRSPCRIREIVAAVRAAVPAHIPVSAKLRLGWDSIDSIFENAAMAAEGGASWLTIHARTKVAGYQPPVYWPHIGRVRSSLGLPVIANGDIWTFSDFERCRDETGCTHFMIGRGALANPLLPYQMASALGVWSGSLPCLDWTSLLREFVRWAEFYGCATESHMVKRMKQWLSLASKFGELDGFDAVKRVDGLAEVLEGVRPLAIAG